MKLRKDSPFKNLTDVEIAYFKECLDDGMTLDEIACEMESKHPTIDPSDGALKRFMRRLREERLKEESEEAEESLGELAERGINGKTREGMLEAARQKLYANALETEDQEKLLVTLNAMNVEKAIEGRLALAAKKLAIEERRLALAEETAKLGWRKLELERAKSALNLMPRFWEILTGADTAEVKVARVMECMMVDGGKLLLREGGEGEIANCKLQI